MIKTDTVSGIINKTSVKILRNQAQVQPSSSSSMSILQRSSQLALQRKRDSRTCSRRPWACCHFVNGVVREDWI